MQGIFIKHIEPVIAESACRIITANLPEWFGIPEANERYAQGMQNRISFAAYLNEDIVGMITLEFPYPNNANIYWMGIIKSFHQKKIGTHLLHFAENFCEDRGCASLTLETLSNKQNDEYYLKTYAFYESAGFKPLFEMYTYDPHNLMVYMQKSLNFLDYHLIDLTQTLTPGIPHWDSDCGFLDKTDLNYDDFTSHVKFKTQRLEMVAGIGTHLDAPAHCIPNGLSIADLPLASLIRPTCMIDVSDKTDENYCISENDIHEFENKVGVIHKNNFVIFHTGWSRWWNQPEKYRNNLIFPSISEKAANLLLERDIIGLGIDTLSPDRGDSKYPVHQIMLSAGKYIIENITQANKLNPVGDFIFGLPIKIQDGTEAPMRLVGLQRKRIKEYS